jgi:hypothetical protein
MDRRLLRLLSPIVGTPVVTPPLVPLSPMTLRRPRPLPSPGLVLDAESREERRLPLLGAARLPVIAHELAHIKVAGHRPGYWRVLRCAVPVCESLKSELYEMGRRVWLGDVSSAATPPR